MANKKYSDLAVFVARKISRTACVPTVEARTGLPPLRNRKLYASLPFERYCCTWGVASVKVETR